EKMNVERLCTTDDPIDNLEHHRKIRKDNWKISVLPAFRPDKSMNVDDAVVFNNYLDQLEKAADTSITVFSDYLKALKKRHDFFAENGCRVSDHGLEQIYADDYTAAEISEIFGRIRSGNQLSL